MQEGFGKLKGKYAIMPRYATSAVVSLPGPDWEPLHRRRNPYVCVSKRRTPEEQAEFDRKRSDAILIGQNRKILDEVV